MSGLIIGMIAAVIILAVGLIATLSVANSKDKEYDTEKSYSSLLWAYVISIPIIIVIVVIAIWVF